MLEVGALDVNGSSRAHVVALGPALDLGVDVRAGPGVDLICAVEEAPDRLGTGSFDVVICAEMLEHVPDWGAAVTAMKRLLVPGGTLVLTTRSPGFPLHDFPHDYWRFTAADMAAAFADLDDVVVADDPLAAGVFARGVRPGRAQAMVSLARIEPVAAPGSARAVSAAATPGPGSTASRERKPRSAKLRRAVTYGAAVRVDRGRQLRTDLQRAWEITWGFDERLHLDDDAGPLARRAFRLRRQQRGRLVARRSAVVEPWFEPARPMRAPIPPHGDGGDEESAPTFVGIGAAKAGTTWWYELLAAHARWHRPPGGHTKELLFFDQFVVRPYRPADAQRYREHFRRPSGTLLGEWTPVYLSQPWAAAQLAEAFADVRLLLMVRDPVERVLSDLRMQYPRYGHDFHTLDVNAAASRSRYLDELRPWLAHFDREQVLVVQFERARRETEAELARTWTHLGVTDAGPPDPEAMTDDHVFHPGTVVVPPVLRTRLRDMLVDDASALAKAFPSAIDPSLWPTITGAGDFAAGPSGSGR